MFKDSLSNFIDFDEFMPSETSFDDAIYLTKNLAARSGVNTESMGINSNILAEYAKIYGKVRAHKALLKAVYKIKIENIFGHKGAIPWFLDSSLCYLATDSSISLGSNESETYHAGAYQANYLTQKSSDEVEITFIETARGDIAKSYDACRKLAFNKDGTVNEPRKYAFKLTISLLNPKNLNSVAIQKSWLVGVKSGSADISATGRSEVVQIPITFQKLRPLSFSQ